MNILPPVRTPAVAVRLLMANLIIRSFLNKSNDPNSVQKQFTTIPRQLMIQQLPRIQKKILLESTKVSLTVKTYTFPESSSRYLFRFNTTSLEKYNILLLPNISKPRDDEQNWSINVDLRNKIEDAQSRNNGKFISQYKRTHFIEKKNLRANTSMWNGLLGFPDNGRFPYLNNGMNIWSWVR